MDDWFWFQTHLNVFIIDSIEIKNQQDKHPASEEEEDLASNPEVEEEAGMLRQQARPQVEVAYLSKTCPILNTAGRTVMNRKKKTSKKKVSCFSKPAVSDTATVRKRYRTGRR
ncbi:hypothetical protein CDAR_290071 [Caerostris darwini]|uniref:Uncharacterized protein n=1 Tax=Caerostris darwini TaxID=1538125 RepID=A0AAV4WZ19_9ARAC|nr:hypothetical protein CDAR_290071 [Caerostris darwini]